MATGRFYPVSKRFASSLPRYEFPQPVDLSGALIPQQTKPVPGGQTNFSPIRVPRVLTPGATRLVPFEGQRALRKLVAEPISQVPGRETVFDAGRIGQNNGRIAILGRLQPGDSSDSYSITLNNAGKVNIFAPNPDYDSKVQGSLVTLGDARMQVYNDKGELIADSAQSSDKFSNFIQLSTEGLGGLQLERGKYKITISRADGVDPKKAVNYSTYTVMGDPGAVTFYTIKESPLSQEEKQAQQRAQLQQQARSGAGNRSSISSLFA
jgi:hypothetical protein